MICARQLFGDNMLSYHTMSPIRSTLLAHAAYTAVVYQSCRLGRQARSQDRRHGKPVSLGRGWGSGHGHPLNCRRRLGLPHRADQHCTPPNGV